MPMEATPCWFDTHETPHDRPLTCRRALAFRPERSRSAARCVRGARAGIGFDMRGFHRGHLGWPERDERDERHEQGVCRHGNTCRCRGSAQSDGNAIGACHVTTDIGDVRRRVCERGYGRAVHGRRVRPHDCTRAPPGASAQPVPRVVRPDGPTRPGVATASTTNTLARSLSRHLVRVSGLTGRSGSH